MGGECWKIKARYRIVSSASNQHGFIDFCRIVRIELAAPLPSVRGISPLLWALLAQREDLMPGGSNVCHVPGGGGVLGIACFSLAWHGAGSQ